MERIDANTTVQSYCYQRKGSFYSLSSTVVLGLGIAYGPFPGNLPCNCYLYGFTFMSEYYNEDLTIISYLRKANRGTQIWYTTNLGASNSTLNIVTATNYTTAWSTITLLNQTSTFDNPPTAYVCSGSAISTPATNVECHTFHIRFSLFVNTTVSADPQTIFSLNPSPQSSNSYFELIYNPSNDSLTINILMDDSTTVETTTDSNLITKNELNELIIEFSKSGAKPPYNVSLNFRNVNQNIYNQYPNVTLGANVSDSFYLTSWCMIGCASYESSAYTKQASNIIFSDMKLICGSNSGLLDSSSLDSSTISPNGTTTNCEYGAITTAEHYYCLACTQGHYEDPTTGCQPSCSSSYYEISTGTCAPLCPSSSVPTGSRYCYYGCMSACSSNCVSCTGNLCGNCTGCSDGYYLENTTYTCQPCNSTCQNCTSDLVCTICQPNFNLTNGRCDVCNNGYYLTGDSCLSCSQPCTECSTSASFCTACQTPFNANNGDCSSCITGFLMTNSTGNFCLSSCPFGYQLDDTSATCVLVPNNSSINNSLINNAKGVGNAMLGASAVTSVAISVASSVSGSFSGSLVLCFATLQAIYNMQYLNINHSKVAYTYYVTASQSYVPNWFYLLNNDDTSNVIFNWGVFERYSVSTLYLDNNGDNLPEILIYISITLLMMLSAFSLRRQNRIGAFFTRLYLIFLNYTISDVLGNIQSQIIYFILQLKDNFFFDKYTRLSLIMGYVSMIVTAGSLIFWFFQLNIIYKFKTYIRDTSVKGEQTFFKEMWRSEKYQVLWSDFKTGSKNQFFFMYWILVFNIGYIILVFSVQSAPIAQCSLIIAWTLLFMVLPFFIRPYRTLLSAFSYFFNFGSIAVIGSLNLYLAIVENQDPNFAGIEEQGLAIVILILINITINMLIALLGLIFKIYRAIRSLNKKKSQEQIKKTKKIILEQLENSHLVKGEESEAGNSIIEWPNQSPPKFPLKNPSNGDKQRLTAFRERDNQDINLTGELSNAPADRKVKIKKKLRRNAPMQYLADPRRHRSETTNMRNPQPHNEAKKPNMQGLMVDLEQKLSNNRIQGAIPETDSAELHKFTKQPWISTSPEKETINETKPQRLAENHQPKLTALRPEILRILNKQELRDRPPENRYSLPPRKPEQIVTTENMFVRYDGRMRARTDLEKGFLMK